MTDVWNWIIEHKDLMNVTGAENELRDRLRRDLEDRNLRSTIDDTGCLFVHGGKGDAVISAMMDVPGYLILQKYANKSVLISTMFKPEDRGDSFTALGPDGYSVEVKRDDEPDSLYYIEPDRYGIGTPLKEPEDLNQSDSTLSGRNITRYALLYILSRLAADGYPCLFASQGFSNAPVEYNFCMRRKVETIVLLGAVESEGTQPKVLVQNGNTFSDPDLIKLAGKAGFEEYFTSTAVTKSRFCQDSGARVLTLALPYRLDDDQNRVISEDSVSIFMERIKKLF